MTDMSPTFERRKKGKFVEKRVGVKEPKVEFDAHAHMTDKLEEKGIITTEQAWAGRDYENLYRAAIQTGGIRDSLTLHEPKGYESDDGNIGAVKYYRALCAELGIFRERVLRQVCIEQTEPSPREVERLRDALDACHDFFQE